MSREQPLLTFWRSLDAVLTGLGLAPARFGEVAAVRGHAPADAAQIVVLTRLGAAR